MAPKQPSNVGAGGLPECLADVESRLLDVRENLNECYRAKKRAKFSVSEHVWKVACLICASASTKEVATSYLEKYIRREDLDVQVEENKLELWYRSLSTDELKNFSITLLQKGTLARCPRRRECRRGRPTPVDRRAEHNKRQCSSERSSLK